MPSRIFRHAQGWQGVIQQILREYTLPNILIPKHIMRTPKLGYVYTHHYRWLPDYYYECLRFNSFEQCLPRTQSNGLCRLVRAIVYVDTAYPRRLKGSRTSSSKLTEDYSWQLRIIINLLMHSGFPWGEYGFGLYRCAFMW